MKSGGETLVALLIAALICGGFWGISEAVSAVRCGARWGGIEHRYRVIGGCQVRGRQGWIPASAYREVSP